MRESVHFWVVFQLFFLVIYPWTSILVSKESSVSQDRYVLTKILFDIRNLRQISSPTRVIRFSLTCCFYRENRPKSTKVYGWYKNGTTRKVIIVKVKFEVIRKLFPKVHTGWSVKFLNGPVRKVVILKVKFEDHRTFLPLYSGSTVSLADLSSPIPNGSTCS